MAGREGVVPVLDIFVRCSFELGIGPWPIYNCFQYFLCCIGADEGFCIHYSKGDDVVSISPDGEKGRSKEKAIVHDVCTFIQGAGVGEHDISIETVYF